jgi:hypothetical protein
MLDRPRARQGRDGRLRLRFSAGCFGAVAVVKKSEDYKMHPYSLPIHPKLRMRFE